MRCNALWRAAACRSALQCIAVFCSFTQEAYVRSVLQGIAVRCSAMQCVAVRCRCVAPTVAPIANEAYVCSVLRCVAVCCSALQRVAVHCSALQCLTVRRRRMYAFTCACVCIRACGFCSICMIPHLCLYWREAHSIRENGALVQASSRRHLDPGMRLKV